MALSRSRCSCINSASFALSTTSSGFVTSLDMTCSGPPLACAVGGRLAPALLRRPVIADEIECAADDLVDKIGNLVRFGIERGQWRQDDRAHLRKLRKRAQMSGMQRSLA